ncbi:Conserved_hypothetical protein [Hexamita inflata]|uniref:Uncharacterized protein n=1 Tax=Hexamita inflata TaxID=28002 RepID=A0ABP1HF98_9EUKA
MFIVLNVLHLTVIQHGIVNHNVQIKAKQNDINYEMFQLYIPETRFDDQNSPYYSLIVNYRATVEMELIICTFSIYEQCIHDDNAHNYINITGSIQIDNYAIKFNLTDTDKIFVIFRLLDNNIDGSVTFQAQSVIVMTPQIQIMNIKANQDLYLMLVKCNDPTLQLVIDQSAMFCMEANAHIDKLSCINPQSGRSSYFINNPDMIIQKVYMNPNCYINNSVHIGYQKHYIFTQEIQNSSYYGKISSQIFDTSNNWIETTQQPINSLTSSDITIISHATVSTPIMPWTTDKIPYLEVWFLVSKTLNQLKENNITIIKSNMVFHNNISRAVSNMQNLSYSLAFIGGVDSHYFQVTNKYDSVGDSCVVKNGWCQLIIDYISQIGVADNILYYVIFENFQSTILYAPQHNIEPNIIVHDIVAQNSSRYYRMKTKDISEGKLKITSNDSIAPINVIVSTKINLPQINDSSVQVVNGIGNVEIVINNDSFSSGDMFIHVQNGANLDIQVQISFLTSTVIQEIIINQIEKVIQLKKDVNVIAGVKIPYPIITPANNGITAAYFSQIVFQTQATLPIGCEVTFDSFGSVRSFRYATLLFSFSALSVVSFSVEITAEGLYDNEFIYLNITSQCDAKLQIISAAAHQLDNNVDTILVVMPLKSFFVHEVVADIDRIIKIQSIQKFSGTLYVCPYQNSLSITIHISNPKLLKLLFQYELFQYRDSIN